MKAQLTITIEDNGSVSVEGPIGDQILAYGLLEAARDSIQHWHAQRALREAMKARQNGPSIVVPKLAIPRDLKGS